MSFIYQFSANNGSVYLYARSVSRTEGYNGSQYTFGKYHLVKMISPPGNDRVGVSSVSICPLQKYLVVGTTKGAVYSIHLSDYNKIGEKVGFSHDFHAVCARVAQVGHVSNVCMQNRASQ
jgi:hypothetical protein